MAMSDTNSNHSDWVQFYHHNLTGQPAATITLHHPHPHRTPPSPPMYGQVSSVAESIVVTSKSISPPTSATTTTTSAHSGIEGRIGKSSRRRSRASRKAPTTLLNTDTANFRAMVQQFTGVPSGPFQSSYQPGPTTLNFQHGGAAQLRQPFELHHQHQHQHQHQQQYYNEYQQQPQNQQTIFTLDNTNNTSDVFLQGFSNTRTSHEISDGFFTENIFPQVMSRADSSDSRTADGFFL